ncbi:uncharacterized protein LOC117805823 [Notolabrus celidotus]|uniref:uncharacterized protein LOC117805823 n=1 Tax=Notolabrus celidotus TaxID=1203425 RepID=UPI00148FD443|nr:uncharacterized protein LOC117805823 [Notolabrus celidotus]
MLKMKNLFGSKPKPKRTESRRPLIENNIFLQGGCDLPSCDSNDNLIKTFHTNEEQPSQIAWQTNYQDLAEVLGVAPDANTSVDGVCCSIQPEADSEGRVKRLIQRSVHKHFPKPPADPNKNLHKHLENVKNTVYSEVGRLHLLLDGERQTEYLIDCYHRQTFDQLHDLIQDISSSQSSFQLMDWVLNSYWSLDLSDFLDLPEKLKKPDPVMSSEWIGKAKDKLLENVQKEVKGQLEKILQSDRVQEGCDNDEAIVRLYVDTIGCIDAMPKEAKKISSKLSVQVQEICFSELLVFLERYTAEQAEALIKEAKEDRPNMWLFFKTLKTCEELKKHVQRKGLISNKSLLEDIVQKLDDMETLTLKLQLKVVADFAEKHLKSYFKADNKLFLLSLTLKANFPKIQHCQDLQEKVMDEACRLIVQTYLKHLLQRSQKQLQKYWSHDVGQTITDDAELLHKAMTELAPGVQQRNLMLEKVAEMLECNDINALKITVASMQEECQTLSDDMDLLPKLLRWKGLPHRRVRAVLSVIPGHQPRPVSCFSCLRCW